MKNRILNLATKLLPSLEIHIWGGLGSQLYALSLGLRNDFEKRRVVLVFHNSGVTKRNREAQKLFDFFFECKEIYDFNTEISEFEIQKNTGNSTESKFIQRKTFSNLFRKIG